MINKVRNGKEVSTIAQLSALNALKQYNVVEQRINEIIHTRDWFLKEVSKLSGYDVFPSSANFLLIRHENYSKIISELRKFKILVRDRSTMHLLKNCFRITIGKKYEMERVLKVLKQF
jgi:histidinol-phosphate aminotransferase